MASAPGKGMRADICIQDLALPLAIMMCIAGCSEVSFSSLNEVVPPEPETEVPIDVVTMSLELDYSRADVSFLLDTTGSMAGLADALERDFAELAEGLADELPEISFGVAAYRDFNYRLMGNGADKPFYLVQQQTTDLFVVQSALDSLVTDGGGDEPESTVEAIHQAAAGLGYDQNCDRTFDGRRDVRPFSADASDLFDDVYGSGIVGLPDGGEVGGMGFRADALPIMVYGTDAQLRTPAGHGVPPNSCHPASMDTAAAAVNALGGLLVGVYVNSNGDDQAILSQMRGLAELTGSKFTDGQPAVVTWTPEGDQALQSVVSRAVIEAVEARTIDQIELIIFSDTHDVALSVEPEVLEDVSAGDYTFEITVRGYAAEKDDPDAKPLVVGLVTGDGRSLDSKTFYVIPPRRKQ